jgi:uncharacterized protein (TIGR03435 family)
MRKLISVVTCLVMLLPLLTFGQAPAVSFEVASIKPAEPITPAMVAAGRLRVGMNVDNTRVDIGYMSLADLIPIAYKVKPYQVSGPDWMRAQRFDIAAKIADGATKEQVPEMLQALLAERFHLKAHIEKRESNVYELVVGKDGHKLKESPPEEGAPAAEVAPGGFTVGTGGNQFRLNAGRDGATISSPQAGTTRIAPGPEGQLRMEMSKLSMGAFAEMLTPLLDRPVVDKTDLKGNYQVSLELSMETIMNVARAAGVGVPVPGAGGDAGRPAQASDPAGGSSVMNSVQQLGLRLESRKAPIDFVVIDSLDKTPTEN